jgi:hypothetical protein
MIDLFAERGLPWDRRPSFADQIDAAGDCWEWTGTKAVQGYGVTTVGRTQWKAHRLIYEALGGPIPEGMTIDHLCRNKICVNPDHLDVVSAVENVMRGYSPQAKHARKVYCQRGHRLPTSRHCQTCANERHRQYRAEGKDKTVRKRDCDCINGRCRSCREEAPN